MMRLTLFGDMITLAGTAEDDDRAAKGEAVEEHTKSFVVDQQRELVWK